MHFLGSLTRLWPKSRDTAIKSATFREILRPKEGLRMTDSTFDTRGSERRRVALTLPHLRVNFKSYPARSGRHLPHANKGTPLSPTAEVNAGLRKTALNAVHRKTGAKMVDFGGWDMPVEYSGLIAEHMAVRTGVGVFDVSHMGDILIRGPQALPAVQHISMNDASKLQQGQAHYSALLYPEGTFVDDVIVHKLGENDYLLVINAGTR